MRRFYGIADDELDEVILWFTSREDAEAQLERMIGDETRWTDTMRVVLVDFGGAEPAVESVG